MLWMEGGRQKIAQGVNDFIANGANAGGEIAARDLTSRPRPIGEHSPPVDQMSSQRPCYKNVSQARLARVIGP